MSKSYTQKKPERLVAGTQNANKPTRTCYPSKSTSHSNKGIMLSVVFPDRIKSIFLLPLVKKQKDEMDLQT